MLIAIPNQFTIEEKFHPLLFAWERLRESAADVDLQSCRIARIECFRFEREHRDDTEHSGLIAISTNTGVVGFKEFAISCQSLKGDFTMWAAPFQRIKGLSLAECISFPQLKHSAWGEVKVDLIESSLMDLIAKLHLSSNGNGAAEGSLNRAFLFDHAQAYVSF